MSAPKLCVLHDFRRATRPLVAWAANGNKLGGLRCRNWSGNEDSDLYTCGRIRRSITNDFIVLFWKRNFSKWDIVLEHIVDFQRKNTDKLYNSKVQSSHLLFLQRCIFLSHMNEYMMMM